MVRERHHWKREDGFAISTDKRYLDVDTIHQYLSEDSYWASGIAKELVQAAIENSTLCYGIYLGDPAEGHAKQIGFARVVSDLVRFAWVGDVFVLPEYRGRGLSKWLMGIIMDHPKLKGVDFNLGTRDAHGLYEQFGFQKVGHTDTQMFRPRDMRLVYEAYGLQAGESRIED